MEKPQQNFMVDNSVKLKKILLLSVFAFCAETIFGKLGKCREMK